MENSAVIELTNLLPEEIDVDGMCTKEGIYLIGKATHVGAFSYVCLANVLGALCRVEVSLRELPFAIPGARA